MKASILIPAFNAEDTILKTIESCLIQGEEFVEEIIVIDDHSTDDTAKVISKLISEKLPIHIHYQLNPTKGACSARNFALKIAKGKAIQWLDADDLLCANKIGRQLEILQNHPNHLITCAWRKFTSSETSNTLKKPNKWNSVPSLNQPKQWIEANRVTLPHCWLGTKKLFESVKPWDEGLLINQDGEYFTRVVAKSAGVVFDEKSIVLYRSGTLGTVSSLTEGKVPSLLKSIESMEHVLNSFDDEQVKRRVLTEKYLMFIDSALPFQSKHISDVVGKLEVMGASRRSRKAHSLLLKVTIQILGIRKATLVRSLYHSIRASLA